MEPDTEHTHVHDPPELPAPPLTDYDVVDRTGLRCGHVALELRGTRPRGRLVVQTRTWFVPHLVLVAHTHVSAVDHRSRIVHLDLARHEVRSAPAWDPDDWTEPLAE